MYGVLDKRGGGMWVGYTVAIGKSYSIVEVSNICLWEFSRGGSCVMHRMNIRSGSLYR